MFLHSKFNKENEKYPSNVFPTKRDFSIQTTEFRNAIDEIIFQEHKRIEKGLGSRFPHIPLSRLEQIATTKHVISRNTRKNWRNMEYAVRKQLWRINDELESIGESRREIRWHKFLSTRDI